MSPWATIPLASLFCYSALLAINFRRSYRGKVNLWFSLYLVSMIIWSLGSFLTRVEQAWIDPLFWNRVLTAGSVAMPFVFFYFVQFFLSKERNKLLVFSLFLFVLIQSANALGLVIQSAAFVDGKLVNSYGPAVFLPSISWPLYIGFSARQLLAGYRDTKDTVYRNRIKYLLSVVIVTFFGTMTNMTSLSVYPIDIAFNVVSAGLIAYAILRYQLIDLSVVIRNGLLYTIPTVFIGALYFLTIHFIWELFNQYTDQQVFFLSLLAAILTAIAAQPIRDKLQMAIDRFFFREKHDIGLMLQRVGRTASNVLDIYMLTEMILREINTNLHVTKSAFFLKSIDQDDFELSMQDGLEIESPIRFRTDHPVVQWLTENDRVLSKMDIEVLPTFMSLWSQEREELNALCGELFIPVKAKGILVGIMAIGPKRSGETFSQEDHTTLVAMANQTAVAVVNARLFAEARQRNAEMTKLNKLIQAELGERLQTQKALVESEERFRRLAENAPDMIYRYRRMPDRGYDFISTAVNQMVGYSPEEFSKNQALQYQIIYSEDMAVFENMIEGKLTSGPVTIRLVRKDGSIVWTEQRIVPIYNPAGLLVAIEGIARDITRRKQDEAELATRIDQLERYNHEINILNEMGDVLQSCRSQEEAYPVIQKYLKDLFAAESGIVYVLNSEKNRVDMAASWGDVSYFRESFSPEGCWAMRRGKPHLVEDSNTAMHCKHIAYTTVCSHLCMPMMTQGEAVGLLTLLIPKTPIGEETMLSPSKQQLVMTVAEHIALALANLRLNETLREQAIRDPLTELFNRRYMEEMLEREVARAIRKNNSLGIIFIDIDHYKQFNDQYGHATGDRVLRNLGQFLRLHTRKEDIACRYGGEEFILILPDATLESISHRAEEIRQGANEISAGLKDPENQIHITLSMGISVFPKNGQTVEALLLSADLALYQAKQSGRNRYVIAG